MTDTELTLQIPLKPYLIRFTWVYVLVAAILVAATTLMNIHNPPAFLGFLSVFVAAQTAGMMFAKDVGRLASKVEKRDFSLKATLILAGVSVMQVLLAALLLAGEEDEQSLVDVMTTLGPLMAGMIVLGAFGLAWAAVLFGFGQWAKLQIKAVEKQAAKKTEDGRF